jgi:hypothetical protein
MPKKAKLPDGPQQRDKDALEKVVLDPRKLTRAVVDDGSPSPVEIASSPRMDREQAEISRVGNHGWQEAGDWYVDGMEEKLAEHQRSYRCVRLSTVDETF